MSDPIDENERNAPVPDDLWGKRKTTPTQGRRTEQRAGRRLRMARKKRRGWV